MSYLHHISTAVPAFRHSQQAVSDFFCNTLDDAEEDVRRKIRAVAGRSGIAQRYSVLEDFSLETSNFIFFPKNKALRPMPGLDERMKVFRREAIQLSASAAKKIPGLDNLKQHISHIITVTCTGLFAPGLDIELMEELQLGSTTQRSSVNFMGCNAAVIALKQADQICRADPQAVVLVVCTELCTIHFQKEYSDDYILSNLLFGDGSAAALVSGRADLVPGHHPLKIGKFHSLVIPEGYRDMAWQLSENGFIMNLTSYVSGILNRNIAGLLREAGADTTQIRQWAIHPGGKRILDEFAEMMHLDPNTLRHSYGVLSEFGNMSSATILFVLQRMLAETKPGSSEIFAAAFGPGLSIESFFLHGL